MKMLSIFAMLLCLSQAHEFSTCSSTNVVTIQSVTLTPDQPEVGTPLQIDVVGNTQVVLNEDTTVDLDIKALGIDITKETLKLCDYTDCPVSVGDFKISLSKDIPTEAPSGIDIKATIELKEKKDVLTCLSLETKTVKPTSKKHILHLFNKWKKQHGVEYQSTHQHLQRWSIFQENLKNIQRFNEENNGVTLAMNRFGDMTHQEYRNYLSTSVPESRATQTASLRGQWGTAVPDSLDWVEQGKVSAVKNQGQCGSCWAFSTTGAIESAYAIAFDENVVLSEQELVDCSGSYGNNGCNGGLMDNGFKYVEEHGIGSESAYPYEAADGSCRSDGVDRVAHVSDFVDIRANDEVALKEAVAKGAVSVAIEADKFSFQFYSHGVVKQGTCGTNLDHGVLLVGYGEQDGTKYWKVKNSWGESWGQGGYVLLERTDDRSTAGTCGIATTASYPVVSKSAVTAEA